MVVKVDDAERHRACVRLTAGLVDGRFDLDELDRRAAVVWSAHTADELRVATADLPPVLRRAGDAGVGQHLAAYVVVMLGLLLVWLAIGGAYPWPAWPGLLWGGGLCVHLWAARSR